MKYQGSCFNTFQHLIYSKNELSSRQVWLEIVLTKRVNVLSDLLNTGNLVALYYKGETHTLNWLIYDSKTHKNYELIHWSEVLNIIPPVL